MTNIKFKIHPAYTSIDFGRAVYQFDFPIEHVMLWGNFTVLDDELALATDDSVRLEFAIYDDTDGKDEDDPTSKVYGVSVCGNYVEEEDIFAMIDVLAHFGYRADFDEGALVRDEPDSDLIPCYWEE